jgi:hypothetical protein
MATEQQIERWATALAEASILGDVAVREKYRISPNTLGNWRKYMKSRPELRRLYERKLAQLGSGLVDDLTARCADAPLVIVKGLSHTPAGGDYSARDLMLAAAAEIESVAALCRLPAVKAVEHSHKLPTGRRVALLVTHRDGGCTLCAVAVAEDEIKRCGREPQILGHLLFCYEVVRAAYRVPSSDIRLLVLADYDTTPLWHRAAAHLDVPVGFYNILGVVRGRLSSQNGFEAPAAAAEVTQ